MSLATAMDYLWEVLIPNQLVLKSIVFCTMTYEFFLKLNPSALTLWVFTSKFLSRKDNSVHLGMMIFLWDKKGQQWSISVYSRVRENSWWQHKNGGIMKKISYYSRSELLWQKLYQSGWCQVLCWLYCSPDDIAHHFIYK